MMFFDDVTDGNDPNSPNCIAHMRPYSELADDLASGNVARYNFITPNQCNDMHNQSAARRTIQSGMGINGWRKPSRRSLASSAYQAGGVLLITWDEGASGDGPIGLIVLSPNAKPRLCQYD